MKLLIKALFIVLLWKAYLYGITVEETRVEDQNDKALVSIMESLGIQCPNVVLKQMYKETGYLTSKIYRENHNCFGMKHNKRGFSIGVKNGHACYPTVAHSLADYAAWQKNMCGDRVFKNDEEYLYFLDHLPGNRRYAEDPNYTQSLQTNY